MPVQRRRTSRSPSLSICAALLPLLLGAGVSPLVSQRARTFDAPVARLPAPTGLFVSWSNGSAVLAWQPVPNASGYVVDHATSPTGPWTRLTRMAITATVYAHPTTVPPGTLLYYQVMAANPDAIRLSTVEGLPALVGFVRPAPQAPRGVGVRQVGSTAVVSWFPVPNATGYRIKSPDPKQVPDVRVGARTRAAAITLGTTGYEQPFQLFAEFEPGVATYTLTAPFYLGNPGVCWPATRLGGAGPGYLKATTSGGEVILNFDPVPGAVGYLIERTLAVNQGNAASWESLACLEPTYGMVRGFSDKSYTLQLGQQYAYRVTAFTGAGQAGWQVAVVDVPLLRHPSSLSVKANGGSLDLFWPTTPGALGYLLETSYGYWEIVPAVIAETMTKQLWGAPPGSHTVDITSLYQGYLPGLGLPVRSSPVVIP